ncbi:hypothetical protein BC830DRAFT_1058790 [Chytriomyces sp. MP71]|nr:hypothetical protein BC830DRAFT_1058790 [Chytriomyces sp. MP71]
MLFKLALGVVAFVVLALAVFVVVATTRKRSRSIAFFHPFCDAGGGGERVLWQGIVGLLTSAQYDTYSIVIYAKRGANRSQVLAKVKDQFGIELSQDQTRRIALVPLKLWPLLEAERYKRLTLIGQSLGSMLVAAEALLANAPPFVFVDTIGFAFTFPVAKLLGAGSVVAYVHYPTISSDMIGVVKSGVESFNNRGLVAKSSLGRNLKLGYYKAFAVLYTFVGSYADVIMVREHDCCLDTFHHPCSSQANSSWTIGHLNEIWRQPNRTRVLYPPCDTKSLIGYGVHDRERVIVSVAQFRPEKAHNLQLDSLHSLLSAHHSLKTGPQRVKLLFIGGARHANDRALADAVLVRAKELGIEENVEVLVNASYPDLRAWLGRASVGLHAMRDEHFGIGIVEYMASGLIPVANNSGGPKMDIINTKDEASRTGYLATTAQEYADAIFTALNLSDADQASMRKRARVSVETRFGNDAFQNGFMAAFDQVLSMSTNPESKKKQ